MQSINKEIAYGVWNVSGIFNEVYGQSEIDGNKITYTNGEIYAESVTEEYENGVFLRKDKIKNVSDRELTVNFACSVFNYDNLWQNWGTAVLVRKGAQFRAGTRFSS